jgi:hypothetical protein
LLKLAGLLLNIDGGNMGRRDDYFSSAGRGGGMVKSAAAISQAHAYHPDEFVDPEHLEKLFLGVDFLNYLAVKLLVVAVLCLLHVEAVA